MIPGKWEIVDETATIIPQGTIDPNKLVGTCDDQLVAQIQELHLLCEARKKDAQKAVSLAEKELTDMYHFIEFSNFNAAQGFQAYKALKDILLERRAAKDEQATIAAINDIVEGALATAAKKIPARRYHPRVLTDLFTKQ